VARLYKHGEVVREWISLVQMTQGIKQSVIRLMSDGKLLKKRSFTDVDGHKSSGLWKIAKLKPEFVADPNLLSKFGYTEVVK
jgi:hypothetical protein